MLSVLNDFSIDKIIEIINEIYDSGDIPKDLNNSIFLGISKKPGAHDCELHQTINLLNHINQANFRILMKISRSGKRTIRVQLCQGHRNEKCYIYY